MKWSMISEQTSVTNLALEWYLNYPSMPGVSHDTANRVYAHAPPANLLVGLEETLVFDHELSIEMPEMAVLLMVKQAAIFMGSNSPNILTGEPWMFKVMYATPHHRIWCVRYGEDSGASFTDDYLAVFGIEAGATTPVQASQQIKMMFQPKQ